MGKKKKRASDKVFCYYCDREFDDEKILVQHQNKYHACNKKLCTASGMIIHVLQVHKEVPNAKPDRDSPNIEIYGMQGVPPEILASRYGEIEEEVPAKSAKVDYPASNGFDGVIPGAVGVGFRPQPAYHVMRPPIYNAAVPPHLVWQAPHPQPWYPSPAAVPVSIPPAAPANIAQQPLFPVQNITSLQNSSPVPQPPPSQAPLSSTHVPPVSQPLFPAGATASIPNQSLTAASLFPVGATASVPGQSSTVAPRPLAALMAANFWGDSQPPAAAYSSSHLNAINHYHVTPTSGNSHSYASGPNTEGPSIGPPPVIANKVPATRPANNEVYLVWDDEALSMEERRMSLPKNQVHDETSQMSSIDAAIDRRISESRQDGTLANSKTRLYLQNWNFPILIKRSSSILAFVSFSVILTIYLPQF